MLVLEKRRSPARLGSAVAGEGGRRGVLLGVERELGDNGAEVEKAVVAWADGPLRFEPAAVGLSKMREGALEAASAVAARLRARRPAPETAPRTGRRPTSSGPRSRGRGSARDRELLQGLPAAEDGRALRLRALPPPRARPRDGCRRRARPAAGLGSRGGNSAPTGPRPLELILRALAARGGRATTAELSADTGLEPRTVAASCGRASRIRPAELRGSVWELAQLSSSA